MSQYAMQMPGAQKQRAAAPNIYAGLMLAAVVALLAAVGFVAYAGMQIGPGGGPMAAVKVYEKGQKIDFRR